MLDFIITSALRFKGLVLLASLLILGYGAWLTSRTTFDVFPEFVPPSVTIQTEAPGFSPAEVESLVTFPIEAAMGGIPGMDSIRSQSIQGLSVVTVVFKEGSDQLADRQLLAERLTGLGATLPEQAATPTISPMVSSTMDLLKIGLVSEAASPRDLRSLADWTVSPVLLAVPGVADVTVVGGEVEELQVIPKTERMAALEVSLEDIKKAIATSIGIRGAGYVETRNQRLTLNASNPPDDPQVIRALAIRGAGQDAITVGDVTDVRYGAMPKFGDALINGKRGVLIALTSQSGANTLETTRKVEAALDDLKPLFKSRGILLMDGLHRPANFIESAIQHLSHSLWLGGLLVALVLIVFLADPKTAFISFISIPLSLLGAVIVLHFAGITLNTMTIGGLAVAVGVVVDDAIIDVENILRRLRENRAGERPCNPLKIIHEASVEVRGSVIYATFMVLAVFLPIFALSGVQGRFFQPLAIAFILAVLVSLTIAMTVTPALCMLLLAGAKFKKDPFHLRWMKNLHEFLLRKLYRFPYLVIWFALTSVIVAGWMGWDIQTELLPEFREGHFVAQAFGIPGSSLEETMRFGEKASAELLSNPNIQTVEMQAGRSERGVDTWGPERCEFHIELKPSHQDSEIEIQRQISKVFEGYPNMQSETLTFLGDRIGESLSGETAPVVVGIFGPELDQLEAPAQKIRDLMEKTHGAREVRYTGGGSSPSIDVVLNHSKLKQYGLEPIPVLEAIQASFQGIEMTRIYRGNQIIPISLRFKESDRTDVTSIKKLLITTPTRGLVHLGDIADIGIREHRTMIDHEAGKRRQVVTCSVEGRGVSDLVAELKKKINAPGFLPSGIYVTFSGAAEAESRAHFELLAATAGALILIGILLAMVFKRFSVFMIVISILPFALAGGLIALVASDQLLSLGGLIGFITLLGLSLRNGIMLMTHYEHLIRVEGCDWNLSTVLRGARERLVPVIMTTAVTGLALLPLALSPQSPGSEVEGPMALVILGGLISSTLMTLLVMPVLAGRFTKLGAD
ncbi:efflux RND transporter permease subunit [Luteolibacter pohnpeiensis]|uniref:Efflux RND transporter permease subunit n=1 Tax=Luteolibacter pohnpeiensis TaxID=454153 RepID=A0A934S8D8_9BACT|nr:efflux RND transporter permease subunit [Luteolibacter pohnpeiensis]MBK1883215.1 efflux RND transporter permease subunit [Luteolibacter pohnpeiensis]